MTQTHRQDTLFLAPRPPRGTETDRRIQPAADHRAEAMHALCHPFTIHTGPATEPVR